MTQKQTDQIRIDKWLWYARQVKTRSLAQKLVKAGHVRVNRKKVRSTSAQITAGDVLTFSYPNPGQVQILQVVACGHRRGPFSEASLLYHDISPLPQAQKERKDTNTLQPLARPDKRERALARKLSGRDI